MPSPYDCMSRSRVSLNSTEAVKAPQKSQENSSASTQKGDLPSLPTPTPTAVVPDTHPVEALHRPPQKRRPTGKEHQNSASNKVPQPTAIDVNVGGVDTVTSDQKPDASQSGLKRLRDSSTSNSSAVSSSSHNKRPKAAVVPKISKHPGHWAPDGSTLVQIKEVHKLHRSRLEKQSDWFQLLQL